MFFFKPKYLFQILVFSLVAISVFSIKQHY